MPQTYEELVLAQSRQLLQNKLISESRKFGVQQATLNLLMDLKISADGEGYEILCRASNYLFVQFTGAK